jgi:hypothetical protein
MLNSGADSDQKRVNLTPDPGQLDGLVESVLAQVRGISRQDAEDAVQDAWFVLAEKSDRLEPGPVGGYLMRTARFKAMKIRDRGKRCTSLDGMVEIAGDSTAALIDGRPASFEDEAEISALVDDPIARRALEAARRGSAGYIAPRGTGHRCSRYSDEQVESVRALRAQGLTYTRIEELTGVPAGYGHQLVKRKTRVMESSEGWTEPLVIDAIRNFKNRHGRIPRLRDAEHNPSMPSPNTACRLFGSWQEAVRAAGMDPPYGRRRVKPWSDDEMLIAFCQWRLEHGHWPAKEDLVTDHELPSPATTRRRLGTVSSRRLTQAVLQRLA